MVAQTGFSAFNDGQTVITSVNGFSMTVPGTASVGDTALAVVLQNSTTAVFTPPTGWASLSGPDTTNNNLRTQLWVKDLAAGEPGASQSWSTNATGSRLIGLVTTYSGTAAASAFIGTPTLTTGATTSIVEPTVTTLADGSWVVGLWAMRVATASPSPTLTYPGTETFDGRSRTAFTGSPNYTLETSHLTTPGAAGSYGGTTATASASTTNQNVYAVVLPDMSVHLQSSSPTMTAARRRATTW